MHTSQTPVFTKYNTNIAKGIAIILMVFYFIFSANEALLYSYQVTDLLLPLDAYRKTGSFGILSIVMFCFLGGFGLSKSLNDDIMNCRERLSQSIFRRYLKVILNFFIIYVITVATSFLGRDLSAIYGTTPSKWIYIFLDVTGLSWIFNSPSFNEAWWLLGLAVIYIFISPLLIRGCRRYGWAVCILSFAIPYILKVDNPFWNYLGCITFGICCAESNVFEKIKLCCYKERKLFSEMLKCILLVILVRLSIYIKWNVGFDYIMDSFAAFGIIAFSFEFITHIKGLRNIFLLLGKHSMNIWLIHFAIFKYYFADIVFATKHSIFILITTLLSSLIISILLELIKKQVGYTPWAESLFLPKHEGTDK